MRIAILAAMSATMGFAFGDIFTALLARKVSGKASFLLTSALKLLLYAPVALVWRHEFGLDAQTLEWGLLLGALFFMANWGFNTALEVGKDPALVGVVAGCFPASAAVAIAFLGQRPSVLIIVLLLATLAGVVLIGLPENWRQSFKLERGILLALLPLLCWGTFGALINKPIQHLGTQHAWFVVQFLVVIVMVIGSLVLYSRTLPAIVQSTQRKKAWGLVLAAGAVIGGAEALQALSLGRGQTVVIETLLGSYPAVYFLLAHHIFKEPLHRRQWVGIGTVAIAIIALSASAAA